MMKLEVGTTTLTIFKFKKKEKSQNWCLALESRYSEFFSHNSSIINLCSQKNIAVISYRNFITFDSI